MTEQSRFFDSYGADVREYSAGDMAEVHECFLGNGVIRGKGNELKVSAAAGVSVDVDTGKGMVNGYWLNNDPVINVPLAAPDATNPRIDLIVMRLDISSPVRLVTVEDVTGVPSANPTAPALTQDGTTWEEILAEIGVAAGTGALTVTDKRTWAKPAKPLAGEFVGTTDTQTLTNKDLRDPSNQFPSTRPPVVTTSTSPYTVPGWNYHVKVDASSGNKTVNLPTAVGHEGESIDVIKIDDSINKVTIDAYGSETIDYPPLPTYVLHSQGDTVTLRSDDANVLVV